MTARSGKNITGKNDMQLDVDSEIPKTVVIDVLPMLDHLYVNAKKWRFFVDLAHLYGVDISDYLSYPVEDEIDNLQDEPTIITER